ncbi:MAG TPA: bifunctional nuclease family protein [Thermoanaerobaculia bacterium]|nr:bifunctional nuclease family protein [Thermoanaerobaculia bacterium]
MTEASQEVRMEIKGLMLDPTSNVPIVILRDEASQLLLPIWIGVFEANAIALRLEGVETPRPMTHDLLRALLDSVQAQVRKVVISDLRDNTFYALIHLRYHERDLEVDSRPSDAIALALRAEAPIFVLRAVLDRAKAVDLAAEMSDEDKLRKWLEEISPEDLGKYTM